MREALLGIKPKVQAVEIPDLQEPVFVRSMTGHDRNKLKALQVKLEKEGREAEMDTHLVIACACDADGNLLFNDKDLQAVNAIPAEILTAIALESLKVSGLVDTAKKN